MCTLLYIYKGGSNLYGNEKILDTSKLKIYRFTEIRDTLTNTNISCRIVNILTLQYRYMVDRIKNENTCR